MSYYLYIIETFDNKLYCGTTNDVLKRFEAHKKGLGAKYTKSHKPKKIVYCAEFEDKNSALKEEYRIKKTLLRQQKLELIEKNLQSTQKLLSLFIEQSTTVPS